MNLLPIQTGDLHMILMMRRNVALLVLPVLPGQEKKMKKLMKISKKQE